MRSFPLYATPQPDAKEPDMTMTRDQIDGVRGYTIYQIGLHWLIAALVFMQLIFGESMTEAIDAVEEAKPITALTGNLAGMHYYFGIAILALVAVRLALRLKNGAPPPPTETRWCRAHSTKVGHLFHAIVGTRSTASWAAIPREGGRLI
jgi:cytochrome b561